MAEPKKQILILGAGVMQGPAIRCAKAMGLKTIVIDGDSRAPLASEADHFEAIDLKDIHKIEEFVQKLSMDGGIDGVMTAGTDFSASVAYISEKFALPGIPYETALDASDKERMRKCFKEAALPSPAFTVFSKENPAFVPENINLPFPYPVVVKPVDNMGSRGCRKVNNQTELTEAVDNAFHFSRSGRTIVEEYMEGPEFSIDAVIYHGNVTICGLADRHIFFPPYFIEMGHTMPAIVSQKKQEQIIDVFIRGIKALGIDNGAAKGDIKLTKKGPMIGEIAARLSGGYMSGWTYPYASGVDPAKGAICVALGIEPKDLKPVRNWTSAERAFISIPGLIHSINGLDEVKNIPGIRDLFLRARTGKRISFPENNVSKAGNVISAAENRQAAVESAEKAARKVFIRLVAPDEETETFLAESGSFSEEKTVNNCQFPPSAYFLKPTLLKQLSHMASGKMVPGTMVTGTIVPLSPFPGFLESDLTDYAGRSPRETLDAVEKLTGLELFEANGAESPVLGREFWSALVRGGYQGAVYYIDRLFYNAGFDLPGVTS